MDAHSLRPLFEGRTHLHRNRISCGLDPWRMIFDGRFKLVLETDIAQRLFNLDGDPWEDINVVAFILRYSGASIHFPLNPNSLLS